MSSNELLNLVPTYVFSQLSGSQDLLSIYNCTNARVCQPPIFDPAGRVSNGEKPTASVSWQFGQQEFEIRCFASKSLRMGAVRLILAWPLLVIIVVLLCTVIVSLTCKRIQVKRHTLNKGFPLFSACGFIQWRFSLGTITSTHAEETKSHDMNSKGRQKYSCYRFPGLSTNWSKLNANFGRLEGRAALHNKRSS